MNVYTVHLLCKNKDSKDIVSGILQGTNIYCFTITLFLLNKGKGLVLNGLNMGGCAFLQLTL